MKTLKPIFCALLFFLALLKSYSQEHPFLIVKENQYPEIRKKAESGLLGSIRSIAFQRWNGPEGNTTLNYNISAYILEANPSARKKYKDKIYSILKNRTFVKPNGHGALVNATFTQFYSILALDIIYNDLTTSQRNIAEKNIRDYINYFRADDKGGRKLARYGINLLFAIYENDQPEIKKWKKLYDDYLFDKSILNDGSWGQSTGYIFARLHGTRMSKTHIIDVMEFTGIGNYYNNPLMQKAFEWSPTFALTPFGTFTKFGDTGLNERRFGHQSNVHYAEKYGPKVASFFEWHKGNDGPLTFNSTNFMLLFMRSNNRPKPVMPISLLKEQSGVALWDKTDSKEALQGILYCLKRDDPTIDNITHDLEESNSFSIVGYGQHLVMNSGVRYNNANGCGGGYPGQAPDSGGWNRATLHNTVLIGNKKQHDQRDGNGLVDGLVGGNIEFGTTDAGPAIKNGTHKRTMHLIQPISGKSNGYFVIHDEVKSNDSKDPVNINFQVNTKRNDTKTITKNEEYSAPANASIVFKTKADGESANLFFASQPSISIVKSYKGEFSKGKCNEIKVPVTDNIRATYQAASDGYVRATTVIFPEDKTHKKPPISKISNANYSGAIISHSTSFKDYYIGANQNKSNTYGMISFKANTTFFRKESGKTTKFSSTNGTSFRDTEGVDYGYQASQQVSIVLENNSGSINSNSNSNVTFFRQGITGVKLNGTNTTVISSALNSVTVTIPAGRHTIELIINGTPPVVVTRPPANLSNGNYFIETPTGGARIKNTNGANISVTTGSGNDVKWTFTKIDGSINDYTLKNVQTGRYLEVPYGACNAGDNTQNPNVNLGTYTQVVANHLRWNITKVGNDYFLQPLHCEKVVDRNNGKKMHLWPYQEGNKNQNWKIVSVNKPPTLSFLRPTATNFTAGDNLTVEAKADDADGSIKKVDLYFDDKFVKKSPQANTHIWWSKYDPLMTNLQEGNHILKLVATDNLGATSEATMTISVGSTTSCTWNIQAGKANDIGANKSHVYVIGINGHLYKSNGNGGWTNTDNTKKLKRIDVAPSGDVWAIGEDNKLWQYKYPNGPWLDKNGTGIDIGVANNVFYILGLDNRIRKYEGGGKYTTLPSGTGQRIDVDGNGTPWIVGMNNGLYQWNGSGWNRKGSLTILDIGIDPNGDQVIVTSMDKKIYLYTGNGAFKQLPGGASQVTVDSDKIPWIITDDNHIYKRSCSINESILLEGDKNIGSNHKITIYPNPAKGDNFTINLGEFITSNIRIYDAQGREVYQTQTDNKSIQIDRKTLINTGLYFIKIKQNKSTFVKKILLK
ncbi:T9SS type A sorting domain-containing protein [Aquimarina algiphila]|uniref:T9SS type A sorting domain-containing protein n=1 Tax=Aquimarina algiphila TaxID=2047982 RepID=A0A554VFY2_9FLAO|nr:T9SS type A sorting domain-containing protein [Aquimarina algiphila]TSE06237.1 T9SS type A sorting domain-containing protein [Aquimarina algiphila]